jgi:methionyl-tRNA formyltransferase
VQSICLLISGNLGYSILNQLESSIHKIAAVFTDFKSKNIIEFCKAKNIELFRGNPRNGKAKKIIQSISCDVLLSVNYLFIIEKDIINLPAKYAINIHGSLLPKYRGRTPHVWAIINGEKETGITAHLIDEKVDNGDIIDQIKIPIGFYDTGADILKKFHTEYPKLVDQLFENIENNTISFQQQDFTKAIYFGRRTPDDGKINWNWSKVRIHNWVRAQATPYPGAFTHFNETKIIINKTVFSDCGFHQNDMNGLILYSEKNCIIVKTPDGALQIKDLAFEKNLLLEKGMILN